MIIGKQCTSKKGISLRLGKKLFEQLVVIFMAHYFEFSKHNDYCKHFFSLFCCPLGDHAVAHWLGNTLLDGFGLLQGFYEQKN